MKTLPLTRWRVFRTDLFFCGAGLRGRDVLALLHSDFWLTGAVVTETQTCENVLTTVWYGNITVPVDHLLTEQANVLRKAMLEARKALDEASEKYEHTLAAGIRPDASDQEMLTTRRVGRAYAVALTQYSNATMAWLTYVDAHLRPKKTGARETH